MKHRKHYNAKQVKRRDAQKAIIRERRLIRLAVTESVADSLRSFIEDERRDLFGEPGARPRWPRENIEGLLAFEAGLSTQAIRRHLA